MKKKHLIYVRIVAISLSCLVATLTLFNLLTVITHGIDFDVPDENNFTWAIDPMEKRVLILTNFTVRNHGAYDINEIDVNAKLMTEDEVLLDFSMEKMVVLRGTEKKFDVVIPVDLDDIQISNWFALLYEDTTLNLVLDIDADYMYHLVHVTVDETLTYQWNAPLSGYVEDGKILPSLLSILKIAQGDLGKYGESIERAIIEYALTIDNFKYVSEDGYGIWVNTSMVSEEVKELGCEIHVPIGDEGEKLDVRFIIHLGLTDEVAYAELKEVNLAYVG